jgi:hypothetical protein
MSLTLNYSNTFVKIPGGSAFSVVISKKILNHFLRRSAPLLKSLCGKYLLDLSPGQKGWEFLHFCAHNADLRSVYFAHSIAGPCLLVLQTVNSVTLFSCSDSYFKLLYHFRIPVYFIFTGAWTPQRRRELILTHKYFILRQGNVLLQHDRWNMIDITTALVVTCLNRRQKGTVTVGGLIFRSFK